MPYETLGKSILESYAYGLPVIASDLGSRRELVEHGVTGLLYSPGDRDHLACSIEYLFLASQAWSKGWVSPPAPA